MTDRPANDPGLSDAALDRLLDLAPAPAMPPGLAARITANATRLPQVPATQMPAAESSAAPGGRRRTAWAAGAIGTALAAGLATLLVLPESQQPQPVTPAPAALQTAAPMAPAVIADTAVAPKPVARHAAPAAVVASAIPVAPPRLATPAPAPVQAIPLPDLSTPVAEAPAQIASDQPARPTTVSPAPGGDYDMQMAEGSDEIGTLPTVRQTAPTTGMGIAPGAGSDRLPGGFGMSSDMDPPRRARPRF